jgi:hypothetical protein
MLRTTYPFNPCRIDVISTVFYPGHSAKPCHPASAITYGWSHSGETTAGNFWSPRRCITHCATADILHDCCRSLSVETDAIPVSASNSTGPHSGQTCNISDWRDIHRMRLSFSQTLRSLSFRYTGLIGIMRSLSKTGHLRITELTLPLHHPDTRLYRRHLQAAAVTHLI